MKKILKLISLIQILAISVPACSVFNTVGTGYITIGVKFPVKTFSVKKIPGGTETFRITITGIGLASPIILILKKENPKTTLAVPANEKTVKCEALGKNGELLAEAVQNIKISSLQTNTIVMDLQEIKPITGIQAPQSDKNDLENSKKNITNYISDLENNKNSLTQKTTDLANFQTNNPITSPEFNKDLEKLKKELGNIDPKTEAARLESLKKELNRIKNIVGTAKKGVNSLTSQSGLQNVWDEIPVPLVNSDLEKLKNDLNRIQNQVSTINSQIDLDLEHTNKQLSGINQEIQQSKINLEQINKELLKPDTNSDKTNTSPITNPKDTILKNAWDEIPFPANLSDFDKLKNKLEKTKDNLTELKDKLNNINPNSAEELQKYKAELDKLKKQLNLSKINLDNSKIQRGILLTSASEQLKNVWDEIPAPQEILTLEKLKKELEKTQEKIELVNKEADKEKSLLSIDLPTINNNLKSVIDVTKTELEVIKSIVEKIEKSSFITPEKEELKNIWDEIPTPKLTEIEKYKAKLDNNKTKLQNLIERLEDAKPELTAKLEAFKNMLNNIPSSFENPDILLIKNGFDNFVSGLEGFKNELGAGQSVNPQNGSSASDSQEIPINVILHNPSPTPSGIGFEEN